MNEARSTRGKKAAVFKPAKAFATADSVHSITSPEHGSSSKGVRTGALASAGCPSAVLVSLALLAVLLISNGLDRFVNCSGSKSS